MKFSLENLGVFVENVSLGIENLGIFVEKFSLFFKKVLKFYLFVIASVAKQSTTRQNRVFRLNLRFKNTFACVCGLLRRVAPRNDATTPNLPKFQRFFKTMLIFFKKMPKFNSNPKISRIFTKKFIPHTKIKDFIAQKFSPRTQNLAFITKIHAPNAYNKGIL